MRFRNQAVTKILKEDTWLKKKKLRLIINILTKSNCFYGFEIFKYAIKLLSEKEKSIVLSGLTRNSSLDIKTSNRNQITFTKIEDKILNVFENETLSPKTFALILKALNREYIKLKLSNINYILNDKLIQLKKIYKLNNSEIDLIFITYLYSSNYEFTQIYNELSNAIDSPIDRYPNINFQIIEYLTNKSTESLFLAIPPDSALFTMKLISSYKSPHSDLLLFLNGRSNSPYPKSSFKKFTKKTIPLKNFNLDKEDIDIISNFLTGKKKNESSLILLYGTPGTGKTEFARSICKSLGFEAWEMDYANLSKEDCYSPIYIANNMANQNERVLIIDEADNFLNTKTNMFNIGASQTKANINTMFDKITSRIIWIVNSTSFIDVSTKRRFDYSLSFSDLKEESRILIWKSTLSKYHNSKMFNKTELKYLSQKYKINAGGINIAVKALSKMKSDIKGNLKMVDRIIKSHCNIMNLNTVTNLNINSITDKYSLDGLNIKGDLNHNLSILDNFVENYNQDLESFNNINLLLYGPSGCGKTEFVKYLSKRLSKKLIVKSSSNLLDKYVGGTEKNISNAFKDAQEDDAILFIDEAESLLSSRNNATRNYEVSTTNELLQCMENFNGIFICATNFKGKMDSASIRRFGLKMEFDYLDSNGNSLFYDKFFSKLLTSKPTQVEINILESITFLTPGDFKTVYLQYQHYKQKSLSHNIIINALNKEIGHKNMINTKKIGF